MVNVDVVVVDKAANKQVEEQVEGSLVEEEEAQASTVLEAVGAAASSPLLTCLTRPKLVSVTLDFDHAWLGKLFDSFKCLR
ncbi:hypothetical protein JG687_00003325 [Phytophthora cactorum]|uniref:Uncharacterized protein n=1 Tax=Phytophthora cactorum TaxID=29920 RepID=A0A8T1USY3_9STRA|nr:hypothetical protein JG687_00003325 [Phytophthora cactorum]